MQIFWQSDWEPSHLPVRDDRFFRAKLTGAGLRGDRSLFRAQVPFYQGRGQGRGRLKVTKRPGQRQGTALAGNLIQ